MEHAEERVAEVVLVVARRHARVAGADAGAERVDRDVEPAGSKSNPIAAAACLPNSSCAFADSDAEDFDRRFLCPIQSPCE